MSLQQKQELVLQTVQIQPVLSLALSSMYESASIETGDFSEDLRALIVLAP